MEAISTRIKMLKVALEKRQDELEEELTRAYKERQSKMYENMKALKDHRERNEETKEDSEDLLRGDQPEKEREKTIVSQCEEIITTTPKLKYIETQLRYTFDALETIERKIGEFGHLHSKPIDSGKLCVFQSTMDATKAPSATPKAVEVPTVQFKV